MDAFEDFDGDFGNGGGLGDGRVDDFLFSGTGDFDLFLGDEEKRSERGMDENVCGGRVLASLGVVEQSPPSFVFWSVIPVLQPISCLLRDQSLRIIEVHEPGLSYMIRSDTIPSPIVEQNL